jgi:hypothetical protein
MLKTRDFYQQNISKTNLFENINGYNFYKKKLSHTIHRFLSIPAVCFVGKSLNRKQPLYYIAYYKFITCLTCRMCIELKNKICNLFSS